MSVGTQEGREELIDTSSAGTGRIEAFSDGVIAIAITLLVLEIKVPHIKEGAEGNLWNELLALWPSYGGYLTSFLVIGIIWINHHQMYKLVRRTNHAFLALNVLFLMVVSFLPFPTGVLSEYIREGREQQTATIFYAGAMLLMALMFNILWRYAKGKADLLDLKLSRTAINKMSQKYNTGLLLYVVAFGLAFVSYEASLGLIFLLAFYFLLPSFRGFSSSNQP